MNKKAKEGNTRKALAYFYRYLKPYWKGITVVIILSLISTVPQVLAPLFLGQAVTSLTSFVESAFAGHAHLNAFYSGLGMMMASYILGIIAILIAWMVMSRFNAYSTNDMRENLFSKFQRMTIRYFDTHQDGKLISLFTSDLDNIFNAMNNAIFEIVSQGSLFIGVIIMMFYTNPTMALLTVATTPIILIVSLMIMRKARRRLDQQQDEISDLNGYINEQINGQKVIITNGLQKESVKNFTKYNDRVRSAMFSGQFFSGMLFPLLQGLSLLNFAIVIAGGSWLIVAGNVSQAVGLGLIVSFVQYSQTYFQPLTQLTSIYSMIQLALTGASRQEIIAAAREAQIDDFIQGLPEGYDTRVSNENAGQKQLISIARTILTNQTFLILDEATSNVDTVTEEKIQKAMDAVIAGRTSFVIAHRLKTILNADEIIVLNNGKVMERGSHQQLL